MSTISPMKTCVAAGATAWPTSRGWQTTPRAWQWKTRTPTRTSWMRPSDVDRPALSQSCLLVRFDGASEDGDLEPAPGRRAGRRPAELRWYGAHGWIRTNDRDFMRVLL